MEIFHANRQWATRPADERFTSLEEMYRATLQYRHGSKEAHVRWSDLRVQPADRGDQLQIVGRLNTPATMTNYAFKQLSARAGAPPAYLATLPKEIASDALNHGLRERSDSGKANLLFQQNGDLVLRAATTEKYERVWNHEVIARLIDLVERYQLVPARSTFNIFDPKNPPALYASDHDMWAFVMSKDREIVDPVGKKLYRGAIVFNSEVGDSALGILRFLFRDLCGNHIIWGAEGVVEARLIHVGNVANRWADAVLKVRQYLDSSTRLEQAAFNEFRAKIGTDKENTLDVLFGKKSLGLSRKALNASYDAVVPNEDGDPNTVWGFAQGITRYSQLTQYADERQDLDRAAGKLLSIAF